MTAILDGWHVWENATHRYHVKYENGLIVDVVRETL